MTKKAKKPAQFIVRIKCEIEKEVICEGCTEEQARNDPFEHAIDEREVIQWDWQVIDVKQEPE